AEPARALRTRKKFVQKWQWILVRRCSRSHRLDELPVSEKLFVVALCLLTFRSRRYARNLEREGPPSSTTLGTPLSNDAGRREALGKKNDANGSSGNRNVGAGVDLRGSRAQRAESDTVSRSSVARMDIHAVHGVRRSVGQQRAPGECGQQSATGL